MSATYIDEIDAIILKRLLSESRTSFTELAKECNISVVAVRMRYKNLWKKGIINGEIMLVNPFSLGYKYICMIGITTDKQNEDTVREFIRKLRYPAVIQGGRFGKYNLSTEVALKNIEQISNIQRTIEANPLPKNSDAFIWSENAIPEFPDKLAIKPFEGKGHKPMTVKQIEIQMDETDREIAKILANTSRMSFRKIGEHLNISTKNVIERYKSLRGSVLTLSTITVDLNKLGYRAGAFLLIKLANKSKISDVETQLLRIPNLIVLVKYIGLYDMFAHVVFEDFQNYFKIENEVKRIQHIDQIEISIVPSFPAWPPNIFASLL